MENYGKQALKPFVSLRFSSSRAPRPSSPPISTSSGHPRSSAPKPRRGPWAALGALLNFVGGLKPSNTDVFPRFSWILCRFRISKAWSKPYTSRPRWWHLSRKDSASATQLLSAISVAFRVGSRGEKGVISKDSTLLKPCTIIYYVLFVVFIYILFGPLRIAISTLCSIYIYVFFIYISFPKS